MRAFLGIGLLGSNFVKALLEKGEKVQVWNRTAAKAKTLEKDGAVAFDTPAEAVKGADFVHLTLRDDDSVVEVLNAAKSGLKKGAIILDHTTTSSKGAIERTAYWKNLGIRYQHAPVMMGPKNARERTGNMAVSGDQDLIAEIMPVISQMTGKVLNFGAEVGKAASMKLISNLFLIALNGGIGDVLSFAKASGITAEEILNLFGEWNPGASITGRIKQVQKDDFSNPSWELTMARKDARLMMEGAKAGGSTLTVIPAVAAEMDKLIEAGFAHQDWSIVDRAK